MSYTICSNLGDRAFNLFVFYHKKMLHNTNLFKTITKSLIDRVIVCILNEGQVTLFTRKK